MNSPAAVKRIVAANGGKLIGKTRLQKTAYFLESLGVGYGFEFDYHYYGPYSEDLAIASDDAKALKLIDVEWEVSQSGMRYAVFHTVGSEQTTGDLQEQKQREILSKLEGFDATTLELAATADFLRRNGFANDLWAETRRRKSLKATDDRIEKAKRLLADLNQIKTA